MIYDTKVGRLILDGLECFSRAADIVHNDAQQFFPALKEFITPCYHCSIYMALYVISCLRSAVDEIDQATYQEKGIKKPSTSHTILVFLTIS
uniref:Uncharacterized protein n=1 Tax=Romanomermis culicivorax TaxID=13658 RepID=A0A915K1T0_ROMCU